MSRAKGGSLSGTKAVHSPVEGGGESWYPLRCFLQNPNKVDYAVVSGGLGNVIPMGRKCGGEHEISSSGTKVFAPSRFDNFGGKGFGPSSWDNVNNGPIDGFGGSLGGYDVFFNLHGSAEGGDLANGMHGVIKPFVCRAFGRQDFGGDVNP